MQFRRVLLQAINESTELRRRQKRRARMWVWFNPHRLGDLEQAVVQEAVAEGKIPEDAFLDDIDWDKLLAFIKEIISLIISLIGGLG